MGVVKDYSLPEWVKKRAETVAKEQAAKEK